MSEGGEGDATGQGRRQPVLTENAVLRYITFAALYMAQGIPEGLTFFAIPAWLAMNGVEAGPIGAYLAVIVLPWSFKLFAGPLMDRWSYLPMGRRRPWVLGGQAGLVLSFLSMTLIPDPVHHITLLSIMGFTVSFFGAFQDVATDGMAVDVVPIGEQARANGVMWGSKVLGTAASLSTGTWLINNKGFDHAVVALSLMVFLIMLLPLSFRERSGEKRLPWSSGKPSREALAMKVESWKEIIFTLKNAFVLRSSLAMAFVGFLFSASVGYMDAMLPLFTIQRLGWTNDGYSNVLATVSTIGAFAAMAIAGWMVDRIGKVRITNVYLILLLIMSIVIALTHDAWMSRGYGTWVIATYQTVYTFAMVAYLAVSMNLCWRRVAATQFTLYMAIGNMGRAVGSSLLGPARAEFNWQGTFLVFGGFVLLAIMLLRSVHLPRHESALERLELDHRGDLPPDLGGAHVPR